MLSLLKKPYQINVLVSVKVSNRALKCIEVAHECPLGV